MNWRKKRGEYNYVVGRKIKKCGEENIPCFADSLLFSTRQTKAPNSKRPTQSETGIPKKISERAQVQVKRDEKKSKW